MTEVQADLRMADEVIGGAPLLALPKARYSTGWFQVSWSDEVPAGTVKLVHYFGQSIVLWRGESGEIYALDAYCLHLGGNLGVGGEVKGEDIECPWHGWNWNGKGRNTLIPYSKKQPCKKNLKMRAWPVRDWAGCIIVWHDAAKREPFWEPPELPELERRDFYPIEKCPRRMWKLRAHPQLMVENGADFAHIKKVHGAGRWPDIERFDFEDHEWTAIVSTSYGAGKKSTRLTPDGEVKLTLEFKTWALGLGISRWPEDLIAGTMVMNITPVDLVHSTQHFSMTTRREPGDDGDEPTGMALTMIEHQIRTVEQDHFTWPNMKVLHPPNFAPEEAKNYAAMRRWARQFYPYIDEEPAHGAAGEVMEDV